MIDPVRDSRVWNSVRWMYIGSGVLFLANISLGITNVFSPAEIARGQVLSHFHAGTIGWVTLSVIATTLWVFTGQRQVSEGYAKFVATLAVIGTMAAAGYIAAFGLAFNGDVSFVWLPVFGIPMWLVILSATIFAWTQLKHQPVVTTAHLLLFGALLVASWGATMGVLWGLSYELGKYFAPAAADGIGAHAAPMDMYISLAFAAFVELQLRRDDNQRWTKPGLAQMVLGVVAGYLTSIALFTGLGESPLVPVAFLMFLVSFGFYVGRVGWRTFTVNPFAPGRAPAIFFGGLAYPLYIALFVMFVFVYFIPGVAPPHWLLIVFLHVTFVGTATNLLMATQLGYGAGASARRRLEALALWVMNLGMLAFFAGEYMADRREGALIMAVGVVASLLLVWLRLGHSWMPPQDGAPMGDPLSTHKRSP